MRRPARRGSSRTAHALLGDRELAESSAEQLEVELPPRLIVEAIAQIQDAGVAADVWKVEGVADPAGCAAIVAAAARRDGRDDTGVVVLGAGAGVDTVNRWLEAAAAGGYCGFAVGRSIWADAVVAHDRGETRRRDGPGNGSPTATGRSSTRSSRCADFDDAPAIRRGFGGDRSGNGSPTDPSGVTMNRTTGGAR